MCSLFLTTKPFFTIQTQFPSFSSSNRSRSRRRTLYLNNHQRPNKASFNVFASSQSHEEQPLKPQLNSYDLMELKFGRLLGEDPKLTLAKIMGRKANPDASYLDIEKSYNKNKGKFVEVEEVPFDVSVGGKSSSKLDGLGLMRPVLAKGSQFKSDDSKVESEIKKPSRPEGKAENVKKTSVPNVILRKPTVYKDDVDEDMSSRLRMRPNLSLNMRDGQVKERFSDMTLLRKPEPSIIEDTDTKQEPATHLEDQRTSDNELKITKGEASGEVGSFTLLQKPHKVVSRKEEVEQIGDANVIIPNDVLEQHEKKDLQFRKDLTDLSQPSDLNSVESKVELSREAALQGKPKRLDQSVNETSNSVGDETAFMNPGGQTNHDELENLVDISDFQETEDADWTRAEELLNTGDRDDVDLVSCNTKGFFVSFGSLVGFLPYRNLASRWKFLAFESWLRQKGLDPSLYKQNLGTTTSYGVENKNVSSDSLPYLESGSKLEEKISPDMKLEDLLRIYDQEKIKFLSSFIGQKLKANVFLVDRKMRKLIFSLRPKEKEELVEKKRNLMARLQVGDIVKCRIQKITYFGIFAEVEGVSALIHQSELSWDATLNSSSFFKIGQVIEAKVQRLNFPLERIALSLKEVMPDPLMKSLESVVGDHGPLDGRLEVAQTDVEWPEVESLIKELQNIEGIQSVSKGRFFKSPGLAPTFQVYMASIFENQYKLLARSENRIQEVIVETSLDKEMMKSAIMTCTNRVE
ncbi:PREDICTED: uncharacterized protein LOC109342045 [Lupinus angustifolius]|uniref:uncharacterized protein LOC109342045 n=1 Tax=Lupinus angustifolius TaxID=3871 RepID=UPI00092EB8A4|nr:PREDICTED: uncharacterized protein LOC109342045 [Lupinus angustifolius]XP_019435561.1 PREDICTED: uncharacterized protein LOC109342045 [Lupinus angustifolius]